MYTMIIVDDEKMICDSLTAFIKKKNKSFTVIGSFYMAADALEFIKENHVDLVLTDIKMPDMSGIEMLSEIRRTNSEMQFMILSGFSDFSYAQEAMKHDVFTYLLKPVDNDELLFEIDRVAQKINEIKENNLMKRQNEEILEDIRERFFIELLFGAAQDSLKQRYEKLYFQVDFESAHCHVFYIQRPADFVENTWEYGNEGARTAVKNYFFVEGETVFYSLWIDENHLLVLDATGEAESMMEGFCNWHRQFLQADITIRRDYACCGIDKLGAYSASRVSGDEAEETVTARYMLLNTYIKLNLPHDAKLLYGDLLDDMLTLPREETLARLQKMFRVIADEKPVDISALYITEDLESESDRLFEEVLAFYKNKHTNELEVIRKIKEYVLISYANDITLEDIGARLYMNSVYLSRFFKQQTGQKFSHYLLSIRMVNAIRLLRENKYKIYEIAGMVGYKSDRHFAKQFKLFTGYTPKQYCRHIWSVNIADE